MSNLILPAGDVRIGPMDYNLYTNAQVPDADALNGVPLKTEGEKSVFVSDVGKAVDGSALQYNIVRVNGQRSVYVPILKQGGDTNTIAVVDGIKDAIKTLRDIPSQLKTHVVFDQSLFVKQAISTVLREGGIGLLLTALLIMIFLGSPRATAAVFLSIPLSVMATFFFLHIGDGTINSMVLSGLALAFSRLIDNSVVVLENIFRHIELGEAPAVASEHGANEVALAVLAITLVTVVVFFPVTLLFGVSKYLFTRSRPGRGDFALRLVLCCRVGRASVLRALSHAPSSTMGKRRRLSALSWAARFHARFNTRFERMLAYYDHWVQKALDRPKEVVLGFLAVFALSFALVSACGCFLLSAHRRRPVRHQRQGAHRHSPRGHRRLHQESGSHRPPGCSAP